MSRRLAQVLRDDANPAQVLRVAPAFRPWQLARCSHLGPVMRYQDLRVGDLMTTAVLSMKEGELLSSADVTMKMADVRHLPVVDQRGHVVGILSNRDVLGASSRGGKRPPRVGEVMSRTVMTVRPESLAAEAAALMLQYKIGSLPVVGDEEELVGVITETDLLRFAHEALGGPTWATERAAD